MNSGALGQNRVGTNTLCYALKIIEFLTAQMAHNNVLSSDSILAQAKPAPSSAIKSWT